MNSLYNLEAEKAVLGGIVSDPKIMNKLSLGEGDFYLERHRRIFKAMVELNGKGIPPDLVTMEPMLTDQEKVALNDCSSFALEAPNIDYYEPMLKELARKRQVREVCRDALKKIAENEPLTEIISGLRDETGKIILGSGTKLVDTGEIAADLWRYIERRYSHQGELGGISSGLAELDRLTDGWTGGDLIILAGRPSSGKSALAMHFVHAAAMQGHPVGVLSLEMGKHQLGIRSASNLSRLKIWKLQKGILSPDELNKVTETLDKFKKLPIWFSFLSREAKAIAHTIMQMVEIHGCRMIVLDYLQLAKADGSKERREREVAEISWTLKTAAQTHNIPVIALAQLNRDSEKEKRTPILSDLRDSGAIEQDADVVMFLYHEGESPKRKKPVENKNPKGKRPVQIEIAKGRNIGTGTIEVVFDPEYMSFKNK